MRIAPLIALAAVLAATPASAANIVETAKGAGTFNTLLTAATAAGLAGTLANGGPFTVFAPTDAAFARLPKGTVQSLLRPENRHKLKALLSYHVVPGRVAAKDIPRGRTHVRTIKSSGDRTLSVRRTGHGVTVDGVRVVTADVSASNGVIHVVNRVLMPSH
ncbi:MAG: fasciclin domain-containing protein [Hyphomicrobiaceae bacterium]